MNLKDTLVISICKINASEMLHLRTASLIPMPSHASLVR